MEHRRFLAHPETHRRFVGGDMFMRIGGGAAVDALIEGFYDRIETDSALRPLFGRDLTNGREGRSVSSPSGSVAKEVTAIAPIVRSSIAMICCRLHAHSQKDGSRTSAVRSNLQ